MSAFNIIFITWNIHLIFNITIPPRIELDVFNFISSEKSLKNFECQKLNGSDNFYTQKEP